METKIRNMLSQKMEDREIRDFSEAELDRVFSGCASPTICKRGARRMIEDGLTIEMVKQGGEKRC